MNLILFSRQEQAYRLTRDDHCFHHIRTVLRSRVGDTVRIGVVNGPTGTARITALEKQEITLEARWGEANGPAAAMSVTVILGHPRPPVLKRLWRDLASLGIAAIRVFIGELGEKSYLTSSAWNDPEYWLREGLSQGNHTALPRLDRFADISEAVRNQDQYEEGEALRFFGTLSGDGALSIRDMWTALEGARSVSICVGPERGLTEREEQVLREEGFEPVTLGPRILRTEAAALLFAGIACC